MANDIKILIKTILADKDFKKGMKNMGKVTKKQISLIDKFKRNWKLVGAVIGGVVVAGFAKLIKVASDAQEVFSKFDTVFSDLKGEANAVAKSLSRGFGLSTVKAKELLGTTGDLLTGFGFTQDAALDLSKQVNELAADLASFTNFSGGAEGASQALTKALLGERESVKSLGISILETDVQSKVLENTTNGLTFATNRQAKAYATLQIAQEQSKNAIGDFQRTSSQFANQMRILTANLQDMAVGIGTKLLPVFAPFLKFLNRILKPSRDLDDVTRDLIRNQTTHKEVIDKLTAARKAGNTQLTIELENENRLLSNNFVLLIAELNEKYEEESKNLKIITERSTRLADAKITLNKKIHETKEGMIDLTEAEAELLGKTQELDFNTGFLTNSEIKASKALKELLAIRRRAVEADNEAIKATTEYDQRIRNLAKSLINNKDKTIILSEAKKGLREDIEKQIALIPQLQAAEKAAADERTRIADEEKDREERVSLLKAEKVARETEFKQLQKEEDEAIAEGKKVRDEEELISAEMKLEIDKQRVNDLFEFKKANNQKELLLNKQKNINLLKQDVAKFEADKIMKKAEVEATRTALSDIATLTASSNKSLFAIGKATALANATMNIYEAVTKTMASVSFPFNIPLAALQAVAGAVQVSKIANMRVPSFAGGTSSAPGGLSVVGERGPELMNVPRGAEIIPNRDISFPSDFGGVTNNETINNNDNRSFSMNNEAQEGMGFEEFLEVSEFTNSRSLRR